MCQLCSIKDIASRDRWPKPLETHPNDIKFLVASAHDEYTSLQSQTSSGNTTPTSDALLDVLRLLADLLEEIEAERVKWWISPQKREQRRRLEADCDQKKLSALLVNRFPLSRTSANAFTIATRHLVNNKTSDMIEGMDARLGGFVKWTLGMNGGIWELRESVKVAKAKV
jgi:hypothetical protein